jgi:hypothetical protein
MNKSSIILFLALARVLGAADTAYSPPVGGMTYTVPAGQTRSMALPLVHESTAAGAVLGRISGIGSNYLEDSGANWVAEELSSTANPYYLRIKTGAAAGRVMMVSTTANTASRVYLNNDGTDLTLAGISTGANGDVYELVLADTLLDLFGTSTLQGGADATVADNVQVWGGAAWLIFYYNTTRNRWERNTDTGASPSRDNFVLRPDRGILIARRAATDLTLRINGRVPTTAPRHFHARPGVSFLSNGLPVDITLGALGLQTRAAGWQAGAVPATAVNDADLIQVWGGAAWLIFYYDSVNARWQRNTDTGASPTRDTFNIPAGRPIMIRRLSAGASAQDGVITLPMPYAINQ